MVRTTTLQFKIRRSHYHRTYMVDLLDMADIWQVINSLANNYGTKTPTEIHKCQSSQKNPCMISGGVVLQKAADRTL